MRQVTRFAIGDILRTSLTVYTSNAATFIALAVIAFVPLFVLYAVEPPLPPVPIDPDNFDREAYQAWLWQQLKYMALSLVCATWLQAGLAYGVVRTLRGGSPSSWETIFQSMRMFLAALLVAVTTAAVTIAGMLLLIVPGIVFALMLWVAVPAAVVERCGVRMALVRSAKLTSGYKGQIFGLAVIIMAVNYMLSVIVAGTIDQSANSTLAVVVEMIVTVVLASVWASVVAVTYHDLRVLKEDVDSRAIAGNLD